MSTDREAQITRAFVSLASDMATGADVVDMLDSLTTDCATLLDVASAGLLLADLQGVLHVLAASSVVTRELGVFQTQRDQGPCRDCYHDARPVLVEDLSHELERWPQFVPAALAAGFASVHAVPLRLRDNVLGALGLFGTSVGALNETDLSLAQALADVASVVLIQERAATDRNLVNEQLQTALNSRVVIEQAKGVLAQQGGLDIPDAFGVLRTYARDHNLRLSELARSVVYQEIPGAVVLGHAATRQQKERRT